MEWHASDWPPLPVVTTEQAAEWVSRKKCSTNRGISHHEWGEYFKWDPDGKCFAAQCQLCGVIEADGLLYDPYEDERRAYREQQEAKHEPWWRGHTNGVPREQQGAKP